MSSSARKRTGIWVLGIAAAALCALVIFAIAAIVFFFIRYQQTASLHVGARQLQVIIAQPANLVQLSSGNPIQVTVNAEGMVPLTGTELWINGVLEGVQAGPSAGVTALTTHYDWLPTEGGAFSLVSRAFDQEGNIATSPAVIVLISPPEQSDQPDPEAGKVYPAVLPAAPAGYTAPQAPADQGGISPASPWQGTPGDWVTDLTTQTAPAAPELMASAEGCLVTLDIHDLSDNEEGFVLYRLATDSPNWVHAADLASHAGEGWIEHQESGLTGGITYYVVAFNAQGESSSNLALVNIDPQACPPPPPPTELPVLILGLENLHKADTSSNIYCYRKLDDGDWTRWPEVGFIGIEPSPWMEQRQVVGGLDDSGAHPIPPSMEMALECWDWEAGILRPLGSQLVRIELGSLRRIHISLAGVDFDINPILQTGFKKNLITLEASNDYMENYALNPYDVDALGYVPESDQMPEIIAWTTDNPDECRAAIYGEFEKEMNCYPMPGFNEGPGGINPQMYLIWSVDDNTCEGAPGKECHTLNWWKTFAEVNADPHHEGIQFMVRNLSSTQMNGLEIIDMPFDLEQMATRISPNFPDVGGGNLCWNGYKFYQVYLEVYSSAGEITGSPSNLVAAPCPVSIGDTVKIEVKWNWFSLDNIDDGLYADLSSDRIAETSGYFSSWPMSSDLASILHMGWGNTYQQAWDGVTEYYELDAGTYDLAGFPLCNLLYLNDCFANFFLQNNNTVVIDLKDNEALELKVSLRDHDSGSPYDDICYQVIYIGPYSFDDWTKINNGTYYLVSDQQDATCTVEVTLNALKPGQ
jgi:hypothetical protein